MAKKPHNPLTQIDNYISSSIGMILTPQGETTTHSRLKENTTPFNFEEYAKKPHMPHALPHINLNALHQKYIRCLDMPIRLANTKTYKLPEEWKTLAPLIEQVIAQEHENNPNWEEYNTYITVVFAPHLEKGDQQRHGGLHVDGFQGERIDPKTKITRNYVMTTNGGTQFYPQRFIVADETKYNVFQGFDIQAESFQTAQPGIVYFMDAYCVHESGYATFTGPRTFLRITYDLKKFDREGNTHNSLLKYDWDMIQRNAHETVREPDYISIIESPHRPEFTHTQTTHKQKNKVIALIGEQGSAKNLLLSQIKQELEYQGYSTEYTSIAKKLHNEVANIIDAIKAGESPILPQYTSEEHLAQIVKLAQGDTGERNPLYNAYSRRNENVRKLLNLIGTDIYQKNVPLHLLNTALTGIKSETDFILISDTRFPHEVKHIKNRGGFVIKCLPNEHWVKATSNRVTPDGFKYSKEALEHDSETALQEWTGYDMTWQYKSYRGDLLTQNLLQSNRYLTPKPYNSGVKNYI